MDKESKTESRIPPSPALVSPREAAVVDGSNVLFEWRPVDAADRYRIQVASDTTFDTLVVDEEVSDAVKMTVADVFPTDDQTFFWRVLAGNDAGWSHGERVESFVSGTLSEAQQSVVPDEEERFGPATELVRSASDTVSAKVTDQPDRFEQEKEQGVAYEGVAAGQIMAISMAILMAVGAAVVILFMWTSTVRQGIREASLDPNQYTDLRETEAQGTQKLSQYEVVDAEQGVYRIPIDQAMDIMVNQAYQEGEQEYSPEAPFVGRQQP